MKGEKTMKKIPFDRKSHGITYGKNVFMIDGYIEDYSLSKDTSPSFLDHIDNKGYVDEKGRIWI